MEKSEATPKASLPWWAWLTVGAVGVLLVNYVTATRKGPVFERVSGATAYLTQVKSAGESMGGQARTDDRLGEADRERGKGLYRTMKMESDGLIAWLQTGLARRFNGSGDPAEYEARLRRTDEATRAFVDWANKTLPRVFTAGGAGQDALTDLGAKLIDAARETDEKMIERLREDLEKCRLAEWDKLRP